MTQIRIKMVIIFLLSYPKQKYPIHIINITILNNFKSMKFLGPSSFLFWILFFFLPWFDMKQIGRGETGKKKKNDYMVRCEKPECRTY